MRGLTSLFALLQPSHYRLGTVAGRQWLLSPRGAPVAWRYAPETLELIQLGPDPFDDDLVTAAQQAAQRGRQRSALIGYTWAPSHWSPARLKALRRLGADSAGKQQYVGYLKERYAYSIERVNEIYGLESTSFSDLLTESFTRLDTGKPAVAADDRQFLHDTASRIAEALAAALKEAHPGALLFTEPMEDSGLAAAMAQHADVLVASQPLASAKAQVLLGAPPEPLPANVVGLARDLAALERLLPIPQN
ncbi:MAG: hypothetical protein K2X03_19745 [Bryobacteraceae bacterium]|nr:hypothetical protein [Bryobacteraceae bacterium]